MSKFMGGEDDDDDDKGERGEDLNETRDGGREGSWGKRRRVGHFYIYPDGWVLFHVK